MRAIKSRVIRRFQLAALAALVLSLPGVAAASTADFYGPYLVNKVGEGWDLFENYDYTSRYMCEMYGNEVCSAQVGYLGNGATSAYWDFDLSQCMCSVAHVGYLVGPNQGDIIYFEMVPGGTPISAVLSAAFPEFNPIITHVGELFGRRLSDIGALSPLVAAHPTIAGVNTYRLIQGLDGTNSLLGSIGFKWNVSEGWLLSANVLMPVNQAGLTPRFVPALALEYNVGR